VEYVITQRGDIYLSTYRSNSVLSFGDDLSPEEGRWRRTLNDDDGGSVKAWIKPSQVLELDWNEPQDGIGLEDLQDDNLPQTNPGGRNTASGDKDNTFVKVTKERVLLQTSEQIKLRSKKRILLTSDEETTLTVGGDLTLDVSSDMTTTVDGTSSTTVTGDTSISTDGNLDITSQRIANLIAETVSINSQAGTAAITVGASGIALGTGSLGGVVGGTELQVGLNVYINALTAAQAAATDPVSAAIYTVLINLTTALLSSFVAATSTTSTVG
jgi:hypothetical protein